MSPIIYTPHECVKPTEDLIVGPLWQCDTCGELWESRPCAWGRISNYARPAAVQQAERRAVAMHAPQPTPTVTTRMVQLVLDVHAEHSDLVREPGNLTLGHCGECGKANLGPHSIHSHALTMAAAALQAEIDGGRDA